jgi:hypothetical protein
MPVLLAFGGADDVRTPHADSFSNCWAEVAKMADGRIRNVKCAVGDFFGTTHYTIFQRLCSFPPSAIPQRADAESGIGMSRGSPLPSLALYGLSCHFACVLLLPFCQLCGSKPLKFGQGGLLPSGIASKPLGLC